MSTCIFIKLKIFNYFLNGKSLKQMDFVDLLLNQCGLKIQNIICRIAEIELYHEPDPYIHGAPEQSISYTWYFHKSNTKNLVNHGYKGGTYKGLDFVIGDENIKASILIRSIEYQGKLIEGPSKVVDFILEHTDQPDIKSLVSKSLIYPPPAVNFDFPVQLISYEFPTLPVFFGPRVGLTLKDPTELKREWLMKHLRYTTYPSKIKKHICLMVICNLFLFELDRNYVGNVFGVKPFLIDRWLKSYELGKQKEIDVNLHLKIKTVQDECILYGYLSN